MIRLDLFATGTDELLASMPVAGGAIVNADKRLVGGLIVPWGVRGTPSVGPAIFRAGSVTVPPNRQWVKQLVEHDGNRSVGYLNDHVDTVAGIIAASKIAEGQAGDEAIAGVLAGTRDAFSVRVEVDDWQVLDNGVLEVRASRLREVSLVSVPAYESARATVLASATQTEQDSIMGELRRMLDLTASAPAPAAITPSTTPTPASVQGSPDTVTASTAPATASPRGEVPAGDDRVGALLAALTPFISGQGTPPAAILAASAIERPAGPPNGPPARAGLVDLAAAASTVVQWQAEGSNNPGVLMAALNDVVPANDAGGATNVGTGARPQWLDELWTARQSTRNYIDALGTPRPLTGLKAKGWRWVTRPQVATYAGNKAAIPSNAVVTEPAEANAHRVAGGWDVDRVFVDLGDAAFIESLFAAATEDYAVNSDAWTGQQLVAAAAAGPAAVPAATLTEALVKLGGKAGAIGARLTFMAVAADVFESFAGLTRDQVPWWLGAGDGLNLAESKGQAGSFTFWADPALAAGTFLAGDSRAATYFEQGKTPIKVQALNIPNGGVDLGVFGYNALIVNDERALWHGVIGA